jgi:putative hydrolase of the HAD superfamily
VTANYEERCVVLDAMGVIYREGDDIRDLLVPYLRAKGCHLDETRIRELYLACSLGQISSENLWRSAGVGRLASDEEYCEGHRLNDQVTDLLRELQARGIRTACLSNDVSEWSRLLRKRFGLESLIPTWVISGDVSIRKPAPEIYQVLLAELGCAGPTVVLVDDSVRNLDAAATLGIETILFTPVRSDECDHAQVSSMEQLSAVLLGSAS